MLPWTLYIIIKISLHNTTNDHKSLYYKITKSSTTKKLCLSGVISLYTPEKILIGGSFHGWVYSVFSTFHSILQKWLVILNICHLELIFNEIQIQLKEYLPKDWQRISKAFFIDLLRFTQLDAGMLFKYVNHLKDQSHLNTTLQNFI